ncbi:hypothetical protein D3C87_472700 [compost metagenome]
MYLKEPITNLFVQMRAMLEVLSDQQYTAKIGMMSNASIGGHIRHVIEFYLELNQGYACGKVNYDQRKRDHVIENNRLFALQKLEEIVVSLVKPDKRLQLSASYSFDNDAEFMVPSSYFRELIYNLEHTVHHMALIRIAVAEVSAIGLPDDFGLAISTLKFRKSCVQ